MVKAWGGNLKRMSKKLSWKKAAEFKDLLEKCGEKLSKSVLDALVGLAVKDAAYVSSPDHPMTS